MSGSSAGPSAPVRSIVIPCYNERRRLPPTLAATQAYLDLRGVPAEILLVDDGCSDGTMDWARPQADRDPRIRVIQYGANRGKGFAVKTGMLEARGEAILFMDADGATPIGEADKLWPWVESGRADLAVGSRRQAGARVEAGQSPSRRLASLFFAVLARALLVHGVKDTQCGFKIYSRQAARAVFSRLTTPSAIFDLDALTLVAKQRIRVVEIPVVWRHDEDSRLTYNARKSLAIFWELLRLKWRHKILWPARLRVVSES